MIKFHVKEVIDGIQRRDIILKQDELKSFFRSKGALHRKQPEVPFHKFMDRVKEYELTIKIHEMDKR